MGADCKSAGYAYEGSNPSPATKAENPYSIRVFCLIPLFGVFGT